MNAIYRDLFLSRVRAAINAASAVTDISHAGLKGQIREILIRDLFRPLLPSDYGIGSGQIISSDGSVQSRQQDIVIYDRRVLPPILFEETYGIFPIESVIYVVEVKSKLTSNELSSAHASAKDLSGFRYVAMGQEPKPIEQAIPTVFAFATDLVEGGKTEIQRL